MGGGLMQLVAYGAQDIYLTGNPQITFFKVVYRRHTNFSREAIEQTFNGTVSGGARVTATISRNGDLLHRMYLELTYTGSCTYPNAFATINTVDLEIGGQRIDRHYGEWMHLWCDLTTPADKSVLLNKMIDCSASGARCTVPLQFWFCRNPGLALPLIALQYHEVKVIVEFAANSGNSALAAKLWCDYIYLDTDERRRFAQVSHEYLIEQVQRNTGSVAAGATTHKQKLTLNHPVKELVWVVQNNGASGADAFNFRGGSLDSASEMVTDAQLKLNGHDRFVKRNGDYFRLTQRYEHHCGTGMKEELMVRQNCATKAYTCIAEIFSGTADVEDDEEHTINLNDATGQTAADNSIGVPLQAGDVLNVDVGGGTTADGTFRVETAAGSDSQTLAIHNTSGADATNATELVSLTLNSLDLNTYILNTDVVPRVGDLVRISKGLTATATLATQTLRLNASNYDSNNILTLPSAYTVGVGEIVDFNVEVLERGVVNSNVHSYLYSFALEPEEHQPSGTCNFSRIDTAELHLTLPTSVQRDGSGTVARDVRAYAVNYNVLRIMSGMGGLAYSN